VTEFLPFEQRVQLAVGAALERDPQAVLHEVTMHSDYQFVYCVFSGKNGETINVKVDQDNEVYVRTNSWPWVALPIEWPSGMNYSEARNLFDEAFPRTAWSTVVLRKSRQEPNLGQEYVFTIAEGYVVVDIPTREAYLLKR